MACQLEQAEAVQHIFPNQCKLFHFLSYAIGESSQARKRRDGAPFDPGHQGSQRPPPSLWPSSSETSL